MALPGEQQVSRLISAKSAAAGIFEEKIFCVANPAHFFEKSCVRTTSGALPEPRWNESCGSQGAEEPSIVKPGT